MITITKPEPSQTITPLRPRQPRRGQSFVELAIMMPVLLLMVAGVVEVVFVFNDFLQMLDAVRTGARFSSDNNPFPTSFSNPGAYDTIHDCTGSNTGNATQNFFRSAACSTLLGLDPITLTQGTVSRSIVGGKCVNPSPAQDDIVITVFGTHVYENPVGSGTYSKEARRFNNNSWSTTQTPNGQLVEDTTDSGWSFMEDGGLFNYNNGNPNITTGGMCSAISKAQVESMLLTTAPSTGLVLIEVFYNHYQFMHLPVFGDVVPNPLPMHTYAFFPLVSAEPTATP